MRTLRLIVLVCLGLFALYARLTSNSSSNGAGTGPAWNPPTDQPTASDTAVPAKVLRVLQIIRATGQPPEGYVGGRVFQNREGRLAPGGDYHEYDVDPHYGNRNAQRIIFDWSTKKAWYTADHYQTFTPLP